MHKPIIRRVGWVLLAFALGDIAWMLFAAIHTHSHKYAFDFTILIASIALLRGNLATADFIRRLAAFGLGGVLCFGPYWILTEPLALFLARLHLETAATIADMVSYVVLTVLCAWTVRELSKAPVMADAENRSYAWITTPRAFAGAVALCVIIAAIILPMENGKTGARAVAQAQTALGPGFHYHLDGLGVFWDNGVTHVSATVAAWNEERVVDFPVAWDE